MRNKQDVVGTVGMVSDHSDRACADPLMPKDRFYAEKMYLAGMALADEMRKKGIIDERGYSAIDTIYIEKYRPSLSMLCRGICA